MLKGQKVAAGAIAATSNGLRAMGYGVRDTGHGLRATGYSHPFAFAARKNNFVGLRG